MPLTIESVRAPRYSNAENTRIDCIAKFSEFDDEVSYTAYQADVELHSREIYQRCVAGEFGDIAEYVAPATPIPQTVTQRQARLALLNAGLLASVQPAIDAMDSPQAEAAQIEWDYASEFRRDSTTLQLLATAIGLDADGLDAIFVAAAAL